MKKGKVLLYWNEKGGVGKTTFAGMAVHELSRTEAQYDKAFQQGKGYKCLLVDLDYRRDATGLLERTYQKDLSHPRKTIQQGLIERDWNDCTVSIDDNLDIIPGDEGLDPLSSSDVMQMKYKDSHLIDKALDSVRDDYDYIVIDTGDPYLYEVLHIRDIHVAVDFKTQGFGYTSVLHSISYLQDIDDQRDTDIHFDGIVVHWEHQDEDDYRVLKMARPDFGKFMFRNALHEQSRVNRFFQRGIDTTAQGAWSRKAWDDYHDVIQEWLFGKVGQ